MKKRPYIMVVDDDREMLKMLNRTLELEGYDVAITADGKSALALVEERSPDLIILDIMIPGPDGFEILKLIRQRSNIPIIMLTARCELTSLRRALVLGADDYIRKPFRPRELAAHIRAKLRDYGHISAATRTGINA